MIYFAGILVTLILGVWNLIYNYRNSRRTSFINAVTAERVKWIQRVRENISTFCGRTYHCVFTANLPESESQGIVKEIDKLRMLIKLQLNPAGNHDKEIMRLLDEIPLYTNRNIDEMKRLLQDMIK